MQKRPVTRRGLGGAAVLLFLTTVPAFADWTPPENPDPQKILSEAEDDARGGRYADALVKHVWFHENSLKYAPAMYGVRLSFALSSWRSLADVYPPALTKLKTVRDAAATSVREGRDFHHSFHDFASINRVLKEEEQTKDLFLWLDATNPETAKEAFEIAKPALLKAKEYRLCGKYLDPDGSFNRIVESYRETMHITRDQAGEIPSYVEMLEDHARKSFSNDVATLVGLLVRNERQEDAERIAAEALKESDDPELKEALARALKGELPPPWP